MPAAFASFSERHREAGRGVLRVAYIRIGTLTKETIASLPDNH
jgi:hypothetical protein